MLDGIVVVGDFLPDFHGEKIKNIRLYSAKTDALEPVPYQIDELSPDRKTFILPQGKKPNTKGSNGKLDKQDELVFMAKDIGHKVVPEDYPAGYKKAAQIEVTDPLDNGKGWVYLFSFDKPPAPSGIDYVKWNPEKEEIVTARYINGYEPGANNVYFNRLVTVGAPRQVDFVDRLKIRFSGKLKFPPVKFSYDEDDASAKVFRYKDGPVRVIREGKAYFKFGGKLKIPASTAISIYYETYGHGPSEAKVSFKLDRYFKELIFLEGTDLSPDAYGMKFYSERNTKGFIIDGKMSEDEKKADLRSSDWFLITGPQGSLLKRGLASADLDLDEDLIEYKYVDDASAADPPEGHKGLIGYFARWGDAVQIQPPKGTYYNTAIFYMPPPNYDPDKRGEFFRIEDSPPLIKVGDKKGKSRCLPWHPEMPKNYFLEQ